MDWGKGPDQAPHERRFPHHLPPTGSERRLPPPAHPPQGHQTCRTAPPLLLTPHSLLGHGVHGCGPAGGVPGLGTGGCTQQSGSSTSHPTHINKEGPDPPRATLNSKP